MAITWWNYNVVLLWKINREKTHGPTLHKCSQANDASQTGVLSKPYMLWHTAVWCTVQHPTCNVIYDIIWSVQLGPVNLLREQWLLVSLHCLAAHRASGGGSEHSGSNSSPTETLDSTITQHTTTARRPPAPLSGGSSHNSFGEESHLESEGMSTTVGSVGQESERNSHIFDFAIMGNHLLIRNRVGFYDLSLYWLMFFHIPSQGTSKALCKNSHSLCKLNSSGLSWPAMPPPLFFPDSQYTL